jgi:phage tail-like protein
MMAKPHLPGTFNSYPVGPKPKHYAPHAQRSIPKGSPQGGPTQPTLSLKSSPQGPPKQRSLDLMSAVVGAPAQRTLDLMSAVVGPPAKKTYEKPNLPKGGPAATSRVGREQPEDIDPWGSYIFSLQINMNGTNVTVAHFLECSGLKNATQPFEIPEGGWNGHLHRRPGQSKWENIVLKYATSADLNLLAWRDAFLKPDFTKKTNYYNGTVAILNNHGDTLRRFNFVNAWPVSWEGPALNAGGSELAIETLEIAHGGLTIEEGGDRVASWEAT